MKKRFTLPTLPALSMTLLLGGSAPAWAQHSVAEEHLATLQFAQADMERQRASFSDNGEQTLFFAAGELGSERVVKGAPYCADAVHETVQWLPDGSGGAPNRIVRQQASRLCRDSEGRTRQEIAPSGRTVVYLRDPVSRESWVLDPERKSARRLARGPGGVGLDITDGGAMREFSERVREWARGMAEAARNNRLTPPTPPTPPSPPTPPTAATPPAPPTPVMITRNDDAHRQAEVHLLRLPAGADMPTMEWAVPPPVQWRAHSAAPRGAGSVSPLPARDIEGLRANGERTTWVIEAGKVGNDKPIQITREVWTAPDLMLTMSSRDFDPRSGEVNYRLKGLKRGEPDAALMRVPADYKQPARPSSKASAPTG